MHHVGQLISQCYWQYMVLLRLINWFIYWYSCIVHSDDDEIERMECVCGPTLTVILIRLFNSYYRLSTFVFVISTRWQKLAYISLLLCREERIVIKSVFIHTIMLSTGCPKLSDQGCSVGLERFGLFSVSASYVSVTTL